LGFEDWGLELTILFLRFMMAILRESFIILVCSWSDGWLQQTAVEGPDLDSRP